MTVSVKNDLFQNGLFEVGIMFLLWVTLGASKLIFEYLDSTDSENFPEVPRFSKLVIFWNAVTTWHFGFLCTWRSHQFSRRLFQKEKMTSCSDFEMIWFSLSARALWVVFTEAKPEMINRFAELFTHRLKRTDEMGKLVPENWNKVRWTNFLSRPISAAENPSNFLLFSIVFIQSGYCRPPASSFSYAFLKKYARNLLFIFLSPKLTIDID